jgi:hypothetical protein
MNPEAMHEYYAVRAPEYDRVYKKPERQQDLRAIERWLPFGSVVAQSLSQTESVKSRLVINYW